MLGIAGFLAPEVLASAGVIPFSPEEVRMRGDCGAAFACWQQALAASSGRGKGLLLMRPCLPVGCGCWHWLLSHCLPVSHPQAVWFRSGVIPPAGQYGKYWTDPYT